MIVLYSKITIELKYYGTVITYGTVKLKATQAPRGPS